MKLDDIVGKATKFIQRTGDWVHYGRILLYASDAEKYAVLNDQKLVKYLKRTMKQEYKQIISEDIKAKILAELPDYFRRKT